MAFGYYKPNLTTGQAYSKKHTVGKVVKDVYELRKGLVDKRSVYFPKGGDVKPVSWVIQWNALQLLSQIERKTMYWLEKTVNYAD